MTRYMVTMVVSILVGCTSSYQTNSDYWLGQGERLGRNGYPAESNLLLELKEKVPFDEHAYLAGYKKGKKEYCDPYRAFEKGVQGKRYQDQCLGMPQEIIIKTEWNRGWEVFIGASFPKLK